MAPVQHHVQRHYVTKRITQETPLWGATSPSEPFEIVQTSEIGEDDYLRQGDGMLVNGTMCTASEWGSDSGAGMFNSLNTMLATLIIYNVAYIHDNALHILFPDDFIHFENTRPDYDFIGMLGLHET